jgi:hypothetical protein
LEEMTRVIIMLIMVGIKIMAIMIPTITITMEKR